MGHELWFASFFLLVLGTLPILFSSFGLAKYKQLYQIDMVVFTHLKNTTLSTLNPPMPLVVPETKKCHSLR